MKMQNQHKTDNNNEIMESDCVRWSGCLSPIIQIVHKNRIFCLSNVYAEMFFFLLPSNCEQFYINMYLLEN